MDGGHLSAQRSLDTLLEAGGIVGHHALTFFESVSHGIVASCPRVVERSLVGTEVHLDILVGKTFPKIDDVADIGHRDGAPFGNGFAHGGDEFVEIGMQLIDPSLFVSFLCRLGIDFGDDAHHACDVAGLGLGTTHAAKT